MATASARKTQHNDQRVWPIVVLLLAAVVVPAGCVIWFMNKAIYNEELAARQRREVRYNTLLKDARHYLRGFWFEKSTALDGASLVANAESAPGIFKGNVMAGLADTLIFIEADGTLLYPGNIATPPSLPLAWQKRWDEAQNIEFADNNPEKASQEFGVLATEAPDKNGAAQAILAQARNLFKSGNQKAALELLTDKLSLPKYKGALDQQGRLLIPNARMMALDIMNNPDHPGYERTLNKLHSDLENYNPPHMPSSQRRFLMSRFAEKAPNRPKATTHDAEMLASRVNKIELPENPSFTSGPLPGYWQVRAPRGGLVALYQEEKLIQRLQAGINSLMQDAGATLELLPPGSATTRSEPRQSLALDPMDFPGWRIVLHPEEGSGPDELAQSRINAYRWTAALVLLTALVVVIFLGRYQRMEMRLSHLKNDLVTTVTHELKTPLASMRMLVDTLLDGHYKNPEITQEYLRLIHKENIRLSRLIENFLTFSRMERNRHNFSFSPLEMNEVAHSALETIENKLKAGGFEVRVELHENLPPVMADDGALVTVVLNLLENAYKYSDQEKTIQLRTWASQGQVYLAVTDKGIGLSRKDSKRIFNRFYRVDQSLSRKTDGVGLGLNIVRYIIHAHHGSISVSSQLGHGSTFTVSLPQQESHHGEG